MDHCRGADRGNISLRHQTLDFVWGIVLIVVAILANRYKSPAMFVIFATLMGWAALMNSLMILVGSGTEKLWSVLGLLYMICTIWIIHEYGKYRDFHPEDESSISRRLGLGSVIVASVNLFLPGIATLLVFAYDSLFTTQGTAGATVMLDQMIVSGLYTISDLAVLALGLGLAVIIREKDTTTAAPLGVLISAVELAGLLCLILVVVVAALIYPGGA